MSLTPVLTRALRYGGIWAVVVAVGAGLIGLAVSGVTGLVAGLLGAFLAAIFLAMTAGSMLFAARVTKGDLTSPTFFGITLGVWFVKLVVFLLVTILLRGSTWMNPTVFGFAVVAAVVGSLVTDVIAYMRARVPYVSDVTLPGEPEQGK
jgi:hypothetical protein